MGNERQRKGSGRPTNGSGKAVERQRNAVEGSGKAVEGQRKTVRTEVGVERAAVEPGAVEIGRCNPSQFKAEQLDDTVITRNVLLIQHTRSNRPGSRAKR